MGFEQFAPARDFSYLAVLLFGVGLGCLLNRFKPGKTARFRNLTVTVGLCFFSGSLAAFTAAIIHSNWMILRASSLYLPLGILVALLALAIFFPKVLGFSLVLITGIFVVWMGYACLRFPVIDGSSQGRVTRDGSGLVHVLLITPPSDTSLSFQASTEVLEFQAFSFSFPEIFPLAGGVKRGLVAEINSSNERLYTDPRLGRFFSPGLSPWPGANSEQQDAWKRFFSFYETQEELETKMLLPAGTGLSVLFDGITLSFR